MQRQARHPFLQHRRSRRRVACQRLRPLLLTRAHQGSGLVVGPGVSEYWVTVFGFPPDFWQPPQHQLRSLLREFSKFGEIFKSGSYSADDANWVHIWCVVLLFQACLLTRFHAATAIGMRQSEPFASVSKALWFVLLARLQCISSVPGTQFTSTVIVGVKPLDPHQRASLSGAPLLCTALSKPDHRAMQRTA